MATNNEQEEFEFRARAEHEGQFQRAEPIEEQPAGPVTRRTPIEMAIENKLLGPAEAIGNLVTRPMAGALGLVAGTAGLVMPGERGQGAQMMGQVQQQATYQPRTEAGKAAVAKLDSLLGIYGRFAQWAGQGVAGTEHPLAGALTESTLQALPTLLYGGARIPLGRAAGRVMPRIEPVVEGPRIVPPGETLGGPTEPGKISLRDISLKGMDEPEVGLGQARRSTDLAGGPAEPRLGTLGEVGGTNIGLKLPEGEMPGMRLADVGKQRPSLVGGMLEKSAARIADEKAFNTVEDRTWAAARSEGYVVPPGAIEPTLTARGLERFGGRAPLRQEAINRNQEVTNKIARREAGLTEKEPLDDASFAAARERMSEPYREVAGLNRTTGKLLEQLKQTRSDAKKQWRFYDKSLDPRVEKRAQRLDSQADEIENHLELWAKLYRKPDLVNRLREARRNLAKNYDVEKATNIGSGDVDAKAIGRKMQSGAPMTGGLSTIGRFARGFSDYVGRVKEVAEPEPHTGIGLSTAGNLHGYLFERGIPFVKGPLRSIALSKLMQRERQYKPGMSVRLADVATRNPYAWTLVPGLGLRRPEEEQ